MKKHIMRTCLVTTALVASAPALAQQQPAPDPQTANPPVAPEAQSTSGAGIDDIIVTARREAENSQRVPVSVQVVTSAALQKLAITQVDEVSKLAPGLTLISNSTNTEVTLRGVTWQPGSGTPATPIYLNEVPFDPANTITSLYDVGQIEVLRGPQGTTRGAPSISGAVTLTTRKPDLDEFGGYIQGLYGSADHRDVQGAINLPIIKDILAVRLAGNIENSDSNRIYSVNSTVQPLYRDRNYRATVLIKPTDTLSLQAMYQRRRTLTREFVQVAGTGSPGFAGIPGAYPAIRANFNGPALSVDDRASVQDQPSRRQQNIDLITVNASWEVFGHTLSYNYGRQINRSPVQYQAVDTLNILPGFEQFQLYSNATDLKFQTHEIRLSSMRNDDRPFDYDLGWFSKHSDGIINFAVPNYLAGAFGSPATAAPGAITTPNARYVLNSSTNIGIGQQFDSFYGNLRFHLGENTELSGGLSILRDRVPVSVDIQTAPAFTAFANPLLPSPAFCQFAVPGAIASPVYTTGTVCEIGIPAGFANATQRNNNEYSKALYNFSASHQVTDALLVYATTGSSFRSGLPAIANPGLPSNLVTPRPETAKSYEIGVKSTFGRRLRANLSVFQLDYKDQLTAFEGVQYFNSINQGPAQTSLAFYSNIDARVRGVELELAAKPVDNLTLGFNLSYSQIKSQGGSIPCNDAARPITAANPINFCPSTKGQVLNTRPPFQATLNGGYEIPFTADVGGYVRFNANYQGKNPNFGNFRSGTTFKSNPDYAIVDVFAGINGGNGAWDLGLYAKNVFDKQIELNRVATINAVYAQYLAPSGYDVVRTSPPREIGVQLRYAFGSR